MKFDLKDYKGYYAMHCKTEKEAENFCKFLHENGRKWASGDSYLHDNFWYHYCENTVYCFNEACYNSIKYTDKTKYKILEWSDYMNKEFTFDDLQVGDFVQMKCDDNNDYNLIVFKDDKTNTLVLANCWKIKFSTYSFTNEMKGQEEDYDIVEVRRPICVDDCNTDIFYRERGKLLFKLEKVEEMTLEEICEELGRNIKIVKEH